MPKPLIEAARRLAAVLRRENEALAAIDLRLATALLPEKAAAIEDLADADAALVVDESETVASLARSLDELATLNRDLLKRAIAAQQRVIGIVVRAAATATQDAGYGTTGCPTGCQAGPGRPMTLLTRA